MPERHCDAIGGLFIPVICVTIALIVVAVSPASPAAYYMDMAGSAAVSIYLLVNGAAMVLN
ncbi:MAG: hypothetical protein GX091_07740 [Peptococcaceae bacterium]|nr:hypothetical protein [Peptococcaceae bacterium]